MFLIKRRIDGNIKVGKVYFTLGLQSVISACLVRYSCKNAAE